MLYAIKEMDLKKWPGTRVLEPETVTGIHPEKVFYPVADGRALRMYPSLVKALRAFRLASPRYVPESLNAALEWLKECTYRSDPSIFQAPDVWMHPEDFELRREGDCEDHALWLWVHLANCGYQVRFVVGRTNPGERGHAWVTLKDQKNEWLLIETTDKRGVPERRISNTDKFKRYVPDWSIDGDLNVFGHQVRGTANLGST